MNTTYKDRNNNIIKIGDTLTFYHHSDDTPKQFNPECYGVVKYSEYENMFYIDDTKMCPYLGQINIGEVKE